MEIPFWAFSKQPPKQSGEAEPYGLARLLRTVWKWYRVSHFNIILMGERRIAAVG